MIKCFKNGLFILMIVCLSSKGQSQDSYEILYLNQDFEQIISMAQRKTSVEDYYWLSVIDAKKGNTLKAIATLNEGIQIYPGNPKIEQFLANLYFETGDYPAAKNYLEKYLNKPEMFLQYIQVLEFQEKPLDAIKLLEDKLEEDSLNYILLKHMGDNYSQAERLDEAIYYYGKVFEKNSNDQITAKKLVNLRLKKKQYPDAIEVCNAILDSDSSNSTFIKLKGLACFNMNNFYCAAECFAYLYAQGDSGKFILKHLGIAELNTTQYKRSREHLLMAYTLDTADYETCFFLGKSYLNSPTPERALFYYDQVDSLLQPDPNTMAALYADKQSVYSSLGEYANALECYKAAYNYSHKPEYLFFIASMYQNDFNDKKNALHYYMAFLNKLPPTPESEHQINDNQITISLRVVAERNSTMLKEELFFEGELNP